MNEIDRSLYFDDFLVGQKFVTKARTITETDIINFCRDNMAHFKCPKSVEFGPLPKTSTGKVQKFRLRDQEWGDKEKQIN